MLYASNQTPIAVNVIVGKAYCFDDFPHRQGSIKEDLTLDVGMVLVELTAS